MALALSSSWSWKITPSSSTAIILSSSSSHPFTISLSSSSSPPPTPGNSNVSKKFVKIHKLSTDESRFLRSEKALSTSEVRIETQIKRIGHSLTFESLFGRRSLWRRIFFASRKVRGIILLNVVAIVYASNISVVKEVEAIVDPAGFTVVRFAISAVPFLPSVFRARNETRTRKAGIELGLWVSLGYLLEALGLLTSDAGRASFISILTVIVVPLVDGMLGGAVPPLTWIGAILSVVGVAMLESSGSPPNVGDLLNFLSAIFFGIHMLRTERISRTTKKENFIPLLGYEICVVALLSMMWYFLGGSFSGSRGLDLRSWTWETFWTLMVSFPWIPAIYTGIFSTGLCLWAEMAAMRDVSATETAIIYGLEPVWGACFAWFLLGERWGTIGWIGAALVLGGSLTVQMFGSLPSVESEKKSEHQKASLEQNGFSTSPVVVRSRRDSSHLRE